MSLLVQAHVAQAAQEVVASWPIGSFIAVNPLAAHERTRFEHSHEPGTTLTRPLRDYHADHASGRITGEDLSRSLQERIPELAGFGPLEVGAMSWSAAEILREEMLTAAPATPPTRAPFAPSDPLERYLTTWLGAFLDPDPQWPMPGRAHGFYTAWHALAAHDPTLTRPQRRRLWALPDQALPSLAASLAHLGVEDADTVDTLRAELAALPGWTSYLKWRAEHTGDITLTDYLAVRLALRHTLTLPPLRVPARRPSPGAAASGPVQDVWERAEQLAAALSPLTPTRTEVASLVRVLMLHPPADHAFTWQAAYENHYRTGLLRSITARSAGPDRPEMQVVMCIDPRSEGVRRHLESTQGVETLGFAGFFGVPVRFAPYQARGTVDSLPALLRPRHAVTETPTAPPRARIRGLRFVDAAAHSLHATENSTATPFALAETTGWFSGAATLARTLTPALHHRLTQAWRNLIAPPLPSEVTVADAFTLEERVTLAEAAIRMMGLDRFAPLIILAGHGSTSTNNLYQSALDCGACGGNPGAVNARAAAGIFNDPAAREALRARGIDIPIDTVFVAALHDTVADTVAILDPHLIPPTHTATVDAFRELAEHTAELLVRERAADLPGAHPQQSLSRLRARAHDWAEVYPELGLAGNAAMVIGPREMTAGVNLHRRVFLHSYRPELDPDGAGLETILTAPLIVAQWINHQYYFSTLNPDTLGAGTKTIHNAIGSIGVLAGHSGDLRRGLPRQSVAVGDTLLHEPLRLSVIAQAPLDRISSIISGNQVLRDLFDNGWITLTARATPTDPWQRYTDYGWATWTATPEKETP
ncbi:DUF2309 domain-containing protein [Microbacterium sp. SCN 69-37]|uniref:DUF2309 domain-containing protein n=1 Tax=Microbacterium sp. SCN 69-37 TaxID=1660115 RepID=UPI00086F65DE|nr:DUF2309 domain-containing protein [Microbacterium sp. SCN 69-37]ODT25701.1 MAG: hypothetical protein ABS64_01105 [Microbacterium sp. SCN 69-37]